MPSSLKKIAKDVQFPFIAEKIVDLPEDEKDDDLEFCMPIGQLVQVNNITNKGEASIAVLNKKTGIFESGYITDPNVCLYSLIHYENPLLFFDYLKTKVIDDKKEINLSDF